MIPKHLQYIHLHDIQTVEIAAYISAGVFNKDYYVILKIMDMLNIKIGQHCNDYTKAYDAMRIRGQKRQPRQH